MAVTRGHVATVARRGRRWRPRHAMPVRPLWRAMGWGWQAIWRHAWRRVRRPHAQRMLLRLPRRVLWWPHRLAGHLLRVRHLLQSRHLLQTRAGVAQLPLHRPIRVLLLLLHGPWEG